MSQGALSLSDSKKKKEKNLQSCSRFLSVLHIYFLFPSGACGLREAAGKWTEIPWPPDFNQPPPTKAAAPQVRLQLASAPSRLTGRTITRSCNTGLRGTKKNASSAQRSIFFTLSHVRHIREESFPDIL